MKDITSKKIEKKSNINLNQVTAQVRYIVGIALLSAGFIGFVSEHAGNISRSGGYAAGAGAAVLLIFFALKK